jgi:DamX protein
MQDNESPIFRMNKIHMPKIKGVESALLTLERAQKLHLLIHLITNLKQSLVICGPNGIGKTVLIDELTKCEKDTLSLVCIQGASDLSFDNFQYQLVRLLENQLGFDAENQDVSEVLSMLDKNNQKVVVIFDDAGQLMPGLIDTLIDFASENKCLKIVFSLTLDEIQSKKNSDRRIDDCHFIDIPPLTEKQSGVFLRSLSAQPGINLEFNNINDQLIEKIYKKTNGIPGEIIYEVSKENNFNIISIEKYKWIGLALIAALILTVLTNYLFNSEPEASQSGDKNNLPLSKNKPEKVEKTHYYVQSETDVEINNPQVIADVDKVNKKEQKESFPDKNPVQKFDHKTKVAEKKAEQIKVEDAPFSQKKEESSKFQESIEKNKIVELVGENTEKKMVLEKPSKELIDLDRFQASIETKKKTDEKNEVLKKDVIIRADDSMWVLKQSKNHYTMQLIVLSTQDAVSGFLSEYKGLSDNLKFFRKRKQGNNQYVVIYGSFKDAATASLKMKSLPARFRKAWIRSFRGLQEMIKK